MNLEEIIKAIGQKNSDYGFKINPPASPEQLITFEKQLGFSIPTDFRKLYSICNGFSTTEDIFNIIPIEGILEYPVNFGEGWYYFAEYMIFSEMWTLQVVSPDKYHIYNASYPENILTNSLQDFLNRFLTGNIFDPGGIYGPLGRNPVE